MPVAMMWVASDTGIQTSDERRGGDGELIRPETKKAGNRPVLLRFTEYRSSERF